MKAKEKINTKQRLKRVLFAIEAVLIAAMLAILYLVMNRAPKGPRMVKLDPRGLEIHEEVQLLSEEGGTMKGYMNIALFGLDAETDSQLFKNSRSDSTMIASINLDTGDIRLVSVYRDSYLNIGNGEYSKATHAYFFGGAEQAVKMLNMNLDMDITDFVAVGYKGLRGVIDGLGGVWIDVDEVELQHINNYQIGISSVLKCNYDPVEKAGYQLLNGLQAAAYCRIRQGGGYDYKRTARQREVLKALEEQAGKTDLATLTNVFNDCIGDIYTSIDSGDILALLANITDYHIVEEGGFPLEELRTTANVGAKGSCVVPVGLEENVKWLHEFLFDDRDYEVTDYVKEYDAKIREDTEKYIKK